MAWQFHHNYGMPIDHMMCHMLSVTMTTNNFPPSITCTSITLYVDIYVSVYNNMLSAITNVQSTVIITA